MWLVVVTDRPGCAARPHPTDRGVQRSWYDANGDPVRQEGQISAIETDTTGATVVVRTIGR
jgi:hypothetical protein